MVFKVVESGGRKPPCSHVTAVGIQPKTISWQRQTIGAPAPVIILCLCCFILVCWRLENECKIGHFWAQKWAGPEKVGSWSRRAEIFWHKAFWPKYSLHTKFERNLKFSSPMVCWSFQRLTLKFCLATAATLEHHNSN